MEKIKSAIKCIRDFCVHQCCCDDSVYVRECPSNGKNGATNCALWNYRMGKNPNVSDERKEKMKQNALKRGFGKVKTDS